MTETSTNAMLKMMVVALIALVSGLSAQTVKDIDGFDKVKWGMTMQQAADAYGVENKTETNEYWTSIELPPITVSDIDLSVGALSKPGLNKISAVRLTKVHARPFERLDHEFDTIKTLLIQKYGQPNSDETTIKFGDKVKTVLWVLPSTSITLELDAVAVFVRYSAIEKNVL